MFEKLKLGTKISGGYAVVLLVTAAATSFALWQIRTQATAAQALATEVVPTVTIANDLERGVFGAIRALRSYGYSLNDGQYQDALQSVATINAALGRAREHATRYPAEVSFAQAIERAAALMKDYEAMIAQSKHSTDAFVAAREAMARSAGAYFDAVANYQAIHDDLEVGKAATLAWEVRFITWRSRSLFDLKAMDEAMRKLTALDAQLTRMQATARVGAQADALAHMRQSATAYADQTRALVDAWAELDKVSAQRVATANQMAQAAQQVALSGNQDTERTSSAVASNLGTVSTVVLLGLLLAIGVGASLAFVITRAITGPVNRIIGGLSAAGGQVASASGQVSSASQQLANGASQQASNLEEISSSLEEVTSMTRQNAENARKANGMAKQASEAADRGASSMERMNDAMQKIRGSATETAKIIKTIDEIAFQTNLLALNAAVEAARAGEAGKGFAVVAEEVRNLAMHSAEAAKTTAALIEDSQRNAEGGAAVSDQVNGILREIVGAANQVTTLVADVATASGQQSSGVEQINTAVSQMDRITQGNAANAEESAAASEELSAQAVDLNDMVDQLGRLVNGADSVLRQVAVAVAKKPTSRVSAPRPKVTAPRARPRPTPPLPKEVLPLDEDDLRAF